MRAIVKLKSATGVHVAEREVGATDDIILFHVRIKAALMDLVQHTKPTVGDIITITEERK